MEFYPCSLLSNCYCFYLSIVTKLS